MRARRAAIVGGLALLVALATAAYDEGGNWLTDRAVAAVERGNLNAANRDAAVALWLAKRHRGAYWYGDVIHHANLALGMAALRAGDRATAKQRLFAAAHTPGSPVLGSFGPNMRLAQEMLLVGEKSAVLEYFQLCAKFWDMGRERGTLVGWAKDVDAGRIPAFGANLIY